MISSNNLLFFWLLNIFWGCVKKKLLWIPFSQSKLINVAKKSTILFLENYPRIIKMVEQYLKAEILFMKCFFHFSIITLRFQLRYHCMNKNSKCDVNFFHADQWQTTQKRTLSINLCTSRTLKIWQYHSSWVTKSVLFIFFHHWIIYYYTFELWCESFAPSWVWSSYVWQIQVRLCLLVKAINEKCQFPQFWL